MAPTMEVDSGKPSTIGASWASISDHRPGRNARESSGTSVVSSSDCSSTCQAYLCSKDVTVCSRSVIPEASPVFRETMNKMKLESSKSCCQKVNIVVSQDVAALLEPSAVASPSFLTKLKSAFKSSSSSISPQLSPHPSRGMPSLSSSSNKTGSSRRPASFGGSDVIKPNTERRASHFEKRVSWADEHGSDHPLFSVRLIRPRLSTESNSGSLTTPGHSILRNTGIF